MFLYVDMMAIFSLAIALYIVSYRPPQKENAPDRLQPICQGRIKTIRGATLISQLCRCTLSGIPTYSRQLTYAPRRRILSASAPLTAPSAVHLPVCFLPDFQRRRLSVKASPTLSPRQRFAIYLRLRYHQKADLSIKSCCTGQIII